MNTHWYCPRLIQLPDQYYKIFQAYRTKQCPVCSSVPKDPCVCLVCGMFVCFRGACCKQQHLYECVQVSVGISRYLSYSSSWMKLWGEGGRGAVCLMVKCCVSSPSLSSKSPNPDLKFAWHSCKAPSKDSKRWPFFDFLLYQCILITCDKAGIPRILNTISGNSSFVSLVKNNSLVSNQAQIFSWNNQ